jgi:cytoskeletal protein CcmA (bactofilin family)
MLPRCDCFQRVVVVADIIVIDGGVIVIGVVKSDALVVEVAVVVAASCRTDFIVVVAACG